MYTYGVNVVLYIDNLPFRISNFSALLTVILTVVVHSSRSGHHELAS